MAKHRSYSVAFKRQADQEFLGGEAVHGQAGRLGVVCSSAHPLRVTSIAFHRRDTVSIVRHKAAAILLIRRQGEKGQTHVRGTIISDREATSPRR